MVNTRKIEVKAEDLNSTTKPCPDEASGIRFLAYEDWPESEKLRAKDNIIQSMTETMVMFEHDRENYKAEEQEYIDKLKEVMQENAELKKKVAELEHKLGL